MSAPSGPVEGERIEAMPLPRFVQIGKIIVNLDRITFIEIKEDGTLRIHLAGEDKIDVYDLISVDKVRRILAPEDV